MPSRYFTTNSQRKLNGGGPRPQEKSGSHGTITVKQSYTGCPLPGKASHNFAAAKKGYREVNGYAAYNGLSNYQQDAKMFGVYQKRMQGYAEQEEAGRNVVQSAKSDQAYNADVKGLQKSDTAYGALYEKSKRKNPR